MKLAVLADIHANRYALEAVLKDVAAQGVDHTVVNGDFVNRGPDNVAVLERVWDEGYSLVLGNHDDLMRKWTRRSPDLPAEWFGDPFWDATAWSAAQLEAAGWTDKLADLPMTHRVELEHAPSLLVSHGSPRHYREGYGSRTPVETLSEILQMHPADILVGSHTHQPLDRAWGGHRVLNTGAVGAPFNGDPRAQYLVLKLENGDWRTDFRRVPYDRRPALTAFETSGLLAECGLSARIFYEELKNARSYLTPFWMWTEKKNLERDLVTWERFQREFPDYFKTPDDLG